MNRLLILTGGAVAALAIAVPAVAGLADNPTFSHRVPVRVPAQAQLVTFDDHGNAVDRQTPATSAAAGPSAVPTSSEPGDDGHRGGSPTASRSASATSDDSGQHSGDEGGSDDPGGDDNSQHGGDDTSHHGGDDTGHHGGDDTGGDDNNGSDGK